MDSLKVVFEGTTIALVCPDLLTLPVEIQGLSSFGRLG